LQYWQLIRQKKFGHGRIERDKVGNRTQCPNSGDGCELPIPVRFCSLSHPQRLGSPAAALARAKTASSMSSVSLPVKVFCWLGW
jgi:hypothetical protein